MAKILIDIPDKNYNELMNNYLSVECKRKLVFAIENGTVLSDNATNGDVIKALFPNCIYVGTCVLNKHEDILLRDVNYNWWTSPYKEDTDD